jgi:hypothetical protein
LGQLHRVAQGSAATRDDADFVNRVSAFAVSGDKRMADFVVGDTPFFFFAEATALPLGPGNDFFDGIFEIFLADFFGVTAGGEERCFVESVGQIRAGKAGCGLSDATQINAAFKSFAANMDFKNGLAAVNVWSIDENLTIETAGPQESAIENIRPIGGSKNDHSGIGSEAVHFNEQLVQSLFALVIDCADVDAALAANGVQFVNEHDAG